MRHPRDLEPGSIETFRTQLVVEGRVAASTQNQALNAILFLYRDATLGFVLPLTLLTFMIIVWRTWVGRRV